MLHDDPQASLVHRYLAGRKVILPMNPERDHNALPEVNKHMILWLTHTPSPGTFRDEQIILNKHTVAVHQGSILLVIQIVIVPWWFGSIVQVSLFKLIGKKWKFIFLDTIDPEIIMADFFIWAAGNKQEKQEEKNSGNRFHGAEDMFLYKNVALAKLMIQDKL